MTGIDTSTPVVVLQLHHGSLGIARSLGRLGADVYAVDSRPGSAPSRSRYFKGFHLWDFAGSRPDQSIEFLLRIGREIGVPSVLIPTSDDTALLVAEHADELAAWYRFPRQCPNTIRTMINKKELYYLALKLGIPTPETVFPTSLEQVRDFAESALFPVMLKGIDGTRLQARTGKKMVIAATAEELLAEYPRLEDPASPNLMLQEYIPGGDDSIWMMDGYFDQRSECRMAITGKKLHQYPTGRGATSLGVCLTNDPVRELTRRVRPGHRLPRHSGHRFPVRRAGRAVQASRPQSPDRLYVPALRRPERL